MLKVGLTGSIGSGKTLVSNIFSSLGIKVYKADSEAKKFLKNEDIKQRLAARFGKNVFDKNNNIIIITF